MIEFAGGPRDGEETFEFGEPVRDERTGWLVNTQAPSTIEYAGGYYELRCGPILAGGAEIIPREEQPPSLIYRWIPGA